MKHRVRETNWSFRCDCEGDSQCLSLVIENCLFRGFCLPVRPLFSTRLSTVVPANKTQSGPAKETRLGIFIEKHPITSLTISTTRLSSKVEDLIEQMGWKAYIFLKNDQTDEEQDRKKNFGFRTRKCPPVLRNRKPSRMIS